MDFALLSVWYSKNQFIYNSTKFPFWHNVLYHSQLYKYYVLYYIEDEDNVKIPYVDGPVKFINFKKHSTSRNIQKLKNTINKIDYMKLYFIFNSNLINEKCVLLMDMDCQLMDKVNMTRVMSTEYYLTPYTDDSKTKLLYDQRLSSDGYNNSFNSYIENYATLINKTRNFFEPCHNVVIRVDDETNQFYMYSQYLLVVQLYMTICHQYSLPKKSDDYKIECVIPVKFYRGGSYYECENNQYKYEYNPMQPAVFGNRSLTEELYLAILFKKPETIVKQMLCELKRLEYDFQSKFQWSNSLQCDVNVCGCIQDRREHFDFTDVEFVMPLKMFGANDANRLATLQFLNCNK